MQDPSVADAMPTSAISAQQLLQPQQQQLGQQQLGQNNDQGQAERPRAPQGLRPPAHLPKRRATAQGMLVTTIVLLCFILIALDRTGLIATLHPLVTNLYTWFVLLSAFGILLGLINVFYLHMQRIAGGQPEWELSLLLVATGLATFVAGLLQTTGVTSPIVEWIFDALLAPGAATLYAVVIFFMAAAAYRYLRLTAPGGAWMLAGTLLMLVVQMPASANFLPTFMGESMDWLLQAPVMATFRGALLGSALALLLVGVRYLLGRRVP